MKTIILAIMGLFFTEKNEDKHMKTEIEEMSCAICESLSALPQFVDVNGMDRGLGKLPGSGVLNLLNGCLVSPTEDGLQLTWQIDGYETTAHSVVLTQVDQMKKFRDLMTRQADQSRL